MSSNFDIAIIGGGAAGLCAAVYAKQLAPSKKIIILEKLDRVGKKLITTGNGQCNILNNNIDVSRYHGKNVDFCRYALSTVTKQEIINFFEKIGVLITFEPSGKAYPMSYQAGSVVDCLRFAANDLGVDIRCSCPVTSLTQVSNGFEITAGQNIINAHSVIIATGLLSGSDRVGSDGSGLKIMQNLGYKTVKTAPSIVQLKTDNTLTRKLKGIKVDARVYLLNGSKVLGEDFGEVLFTDYGLSGPAVMQLSRPAGQGVSPLTVRLDLTPNYSENQLIKILKARAASLKCRTCEEFLTGMLNKRVGQAILKQCGVELSSSVADIFAELPDIAAKIKALDFTVTGTTGFVNSQVTAGGLDTSGFDCETMQSKKHKGLFAVGELLDIDGDCGGFNLTWCWASAMIAARCATQI